MAHIVRYVDSSLFDFLTTFDLCRELENKKYDFEDSYEFLLQGRISS